MNIKPKQDTIQLDLNAKDFDGLLDKSYKGVPSAHDPNKMYFPYYDGNKWMCNGPDGPCEHFRIYGTDCRHILEMKLISVEDMYKRICEKVEYNRDIRDMDCDEFDDIVCYVEMFRAHDMNILSTLMMNIALMYGQVSTDELHTATNESYAGDKIMGTVVAFLKKNGLIEHIGYKKTERKCAHNRPIGVYKLTKKGFEFVADYQKGMKKRT